MSREIGDTNATVVVGKQLEPVILLKLEIDVDPVYAHSGVGVITFDGDDYVGVGQLGSISNPKESELVGPASLVITLTGLNANLIAQALNSANYGDQVTLYEGYRQDDGTLYQDPFVLWSGTVDQTSVISGIDSSVSISLQHEFASLDEIDGTRFTDEDQQNAYPGDQFFEHIADVPSLRLLWAGGPTRTGRTPEGPPEGPTDGQTTL